MRESETLTIRLARFASASVDPTGPSGVEEQGEATTRVVFMSSIHSKAQANALCRDIDPLGRLFLLNV